MAKKKKYKESSGGGAFSPLMKLSSNIDKIEKRESKSEKEFLNKRLEAKDESEVNKLNYQRGLKKEEYSKEKSATKLKAYSQVADRLNVGGVFFSKERVLKKPTAKIQTLNPEKAIMKGTGNLKLVREIERKEFIPDNRSLFFKDSFAKEVENEKKWLRR